MSCLLSVDAAFGGKGTLQGGAWLPIILLPHRVLKRRCIDDFRQLLAFPCSDLNCPYRKLPPFCSSCGMLHRATVAV